MLPPLLPLLPLPPPLPLPLPLPLPSESALFLLLLDALASQSHQGFDLYYEALEAFEVQTKRLFTRLFRFG